MAVNIAVVGLGNWGKNVLSTFNKLDGCRVVAVVDESEPARLSAAEEASSPAFISLEAALGEVEFDAVAIATPVFTHAKVATEALAADKHVWVEKPMTSSSADARNLLSEALLRDTSFMVDHLMLYHPAIEAIEKMVDEGMLGTLLHANCQRGALGIIRTEENALWSLAPHDVSLMLHFLGTPRAYSAAGACLLGEVEDVVTGSVSFDGSFATFRASWHDPVKTRTFTLCGTKGMVHYDDVSKHLTFTEVHEGKQTAKTEWPYEYNVEPLKNAAEYFLRSIEDGTPTKSGPREGLEVVRTLEALQSRVEETEWL